MKKSLSHEQVLRLARLTVAAGFHGVVASAQEGRGLRRVLPREALIITPATQSPGEPANDQSRAATPAKAIRADATHLVIGRSISRSPDPAGSYAAICAQVAAAALP